MPHTLDSPCNPLKQRREEWGHLRVEAVEGLARKRMTLTMMTAREVGSSGPGASLLGNSVKASKVCTMLFPRCIHRRLRCVLLHEFHTTRPYLRESLDVFQIDPITAHAIILSKPLSPGRSQSKSDCKNTKTLRAGKHRKENSDRIERYSESKTFSSRLRLSNRRVRYSRTVGGTEVIGPRPARVLNGRLSSPSNPTGREAHIGASENAGGLLCPSHAVLFHLFPSTVRSQRR